MVNNITTKVEDFFSKSPIITYRKNDIIIRADDVPSGVFYLKNGFARLYSISENGRELTLNIFSPGSFFPMIWALGNIPNSYFYQAITPTEFYRLPKNVVIEFIQKNPDVLFDLNRRILRGMDGLLTNIDHLLSGNSKNRIVAGLLILAKRFGEKNKNGKTVITIPLTHQDLANLSGLTRETTSLILENLEKEGIIIFNRHQIIITDMKKVETQIYLAKEELALPTAL
jgi:CRP/FNR family cyclic AMP-dependent transcriptional regulator